VRSQDGWTVFIKWVEVCGVPAGGEALYDVKGCSGCHGADGEGALPGAHMPAPALKGRPLDVAQTFARLRAGGEEHGKANAFTPPQLSEAELRQILAWLAGDRASAGGYVVPENRRVTLLAFEAGGQPLTGKDGLIQLVVAMDDFVGRFSHWVSEIDIQ
jgi:cytochrome c553